MYKMTSYEFKTLGYNNPNFFQMKKNSFNSTVYTSIPYDEKFAGS